MDMWMDVDTALTAVPVNLMPLIDDTDFKTRETAVAYNAGGMDLVWNFVTTAGTFTQTAVTPTTAGTYDWTHQGDAMYTIEVPASGGVSINNDTEGFGWFTGLVTGVLPFRGPVIGFRAAALNNALIDGGAVLDTNVTQAAGTPWGSGAITAAAIATGAIDADALAADAGTEIGTAVWASATRTVTAATNITSTGGTTVPQTGDSFARLGAPAGASVSADVAAVKTDTGNLVTRITATLFSGITSMAQWLGLLAGKQVGNITARTELRATGAGAGTFDETTDSQEALRDRGDAAWVTATGFSTLDAAGVRTAVGLASANLDTQLSNMPDDAALASVQATLSAEIAAVPADAINEVVEGTTTVRQSLRLSNAAAAGKVAGAATSSITLRDLADTKNRITATVDADGNRTAITRDVS